MLALTSTMEAMFMGDLPLLTGSKSFNRNLRLRISKLSLSNVIDRHFGDLGNLVVDANGNAIYTFVDQVISLTGWTNIIGRALVVGSIYLNVKAIGGNDRLYIDLTFLCCSCTAERMTWDSETLQAHIQPEIQEVESHVVS